MILLENQLDENPFAISGSIDSTEFDSLQLSAFVIVFLVAVEDHLAQFEEKGLAKVR